MNSHKKIIFIGSVLFSSKILEKIIKMKINIDLVICKKKSPYNSDFFDLSKICIKNNINFKFINDINSTTSLKVIKNTYPDIILCFGWSQILKDKILSIPKNGVIGYHPSLLPFNRGCHPIIWALALGLKKTGSTFFWMNKKIDDGEIISQKKINITDNDNSNSLYKKIITTSLNQISNFLPKIYVNKSIKFNFKKNNTPTFPNYWRKRKFLDGQIDWRMNSENIYNLIRSLSKPYVGSHFIYNGNIIKVWDSMKKKTSLNNYIPGQIIKINHKFIEIKCGKGSIIIKRTKELNNLKEKDYIE